MSKEKQNKNKNKPQTDQKNKEKYNTEFSQKTEALNLSQSRHKKE